MGWIAAVLVGTFCGWILSIVLYGHTKRSLLLPIFYSIFAAVLFQGVHGILFGIPEDSSMMRIVFMGSLWGLFGSILVLGIYCYSEFVYSGEL